MKLNKIVQVSSYREEKTHTHTHIQKKNKTNPFNAGSYKNRFLNERKKKKVNLNPLYDIIHKHLFETIIGKLKHNSCRIKLLNKAKENM